jgi:hypothetical protein
MFQMTTTYATFECTQGYCAMPCTDALLSWNPMDLSLLEQERNPGKGLSGGCKRLE